MTKQGHPIKRRDVITTLGLGAVAAVALPRPIVSAEPTKQEQANINVVNAMCATWVAPVDFEKMSMFLADDCVYRASETTPATTGRTAIIEFLQGFAGQATSVEFEIVDTFARGSIVVNERFDRFSLPTRKIEWHGVGVFYIKDGVIAEWSDFTVR
jgi:limonene-1,2-epoxide hydrolase